MTDMDPSLPLANTMTSEEFELARKLSNFGENEPSIAADIPKPATPPLMPLDFQVVVDFLKACEASNPRVTYGLGKKVPFFKAKPGKDFTKVDCSGFVREAIREATNPLVAFPDGSVVQHDWVKKHGYVPTTINAAKKTDGRVRIAFLSPDDTTSGIGHVVLIRNGKTAESHGGTGPDSRDWLGTSWQAKAHVYELT